MFSKNSFIPPYVKKDLKWFERDGLMTYIDRMNYERFEEDRDNYLTNVNVVNFDIINHELKGNPLEKDILTYKTIHKKDLKQMPASDKHAALAACFRSERKDLNIEKDLRDEYFKTWTNSSNSSSNSKDLKVVCSKDKDAVKKKQQKYFDCW